MPFGIEKIFSFGGKKEEKKPESQDLPGSFRPGQKIQKDVPTNSLLAVKPEAIETRETGTKPETKEPQLHGFKIGDRVLLRDPINGDNIFKTKEAEITGPAKNANQIKIQMDNTNSPFGPKLVYDVHPSDLIKLNEHEQRMAKQLGMQEVRFFKDLLVKIEKTEERIAEVKSRHIFDEAMEDKVWELKRVAQQLQDKMFKDKIEKKEIENIRQELWTLLGNISDMLDNIEENYPSDDFERIRTRRGYGGRK